jgi:transcription antitermination factor NusG
LPWFAIVSKPQHERTVLDGLVQKNLEGFLPSYWATRRWSDRMKRVQAPLFPQYVFCRFDPDRRLPVLQTPGVRSIISFGTRPTSIPEGEIERIRAIVASGSPLEPWPFLKAGQRVRVDDGPLAGLEGILAEGGNIRRVVVSLELLQRSVAVQFDRAHISPM